MSSDTAQAVEPVEDVLQDPLRDPLRAPIQRLAASAPIQFKGDVDQAGPTFRRSWVKSAKNAVTWLVKNSGLDEDQYEDAVAFLPAKDQPLARQMLGIDAEEPPEKDVAQDVVDELAVEEVVEKAVALAPLPVEDVIDPSGQEAEPVQKDEQEDVVQEEVEKDEKPDASFGQWSEFMAANAQPEETQRFGIEVELKTIEIPYDDKFLEWAKEYGHKNVFNHDKLPLSVQLDQAVSGKGALLELVTDPLVEKSLARTLVNMRTQLAKVKDASSMKAWLAGKCTPAPGVPAWVVAYIDDNLSMGKGKLFPNMLQLTTTLTASEMAQVHTGPLMTAPRVSYPKPDQIEKGGDAAIQGFLAKLPAHDEIGAAKGGGTLIKHAAEQFDADGGGIDEDTPVTKLGKSGPLAGLHTRANKIAKLYTRKKQIAYVVEFRGADPVTHDIATWLSSNDPASTVERLLRRMKP